MAAPSPIGTATERAIAVVSRVPTMRGKAAYGESVSEVKNSPAGTRLKNSIAGSTTATRIPAVTRTDVAAAVISAVLMAASPGRGLAVSTGAGPAPEGGPG